MSPIHFIADAKKEKKALVGVLDKIYLPSERSGSSGDVFVLFPLSARSKDKEILARQMAKNIWESDVFEHMRDASEKQSTVGSIIDRALYH